MTRLYRAYGLTFASEVDLPELERAADEDPIDISIAFEPVTGPMPPQPGDRHCEIGDDGAYFAWNGLARIRIDGWRRIMVDPQPGIGDPTLAFALLGPVMATLLHGRGDLILHGSAVEIAPGRALLFVGDNGAGKSTLAAACLKAGHALVNDDVAAIHVAGDGPASIRWGFPATKLSRDTLAALGPMPGALLPSPIADPAKQRLRLNAVEERPLRLAHIFLLRRGDSIAAQPLEPADRLNLAMRYSYMPKLGPTALSSALAPRHFRHCATLAHQVPASILPVPDGIGALEEMVSRIAEQQWARTDSGAPVAL